MRSLLLATCLLAFSLGGVSSNPDAKLLPPTVVPKASDFLPPEPPARILCSPEELSKAGLKVYSCSNNVTAYAEKVKAMGDTVYHDECEDQNNFTVSCVDNFLRDCYTEEGFHRRTFVLSKYWAATHPLSPERHHPCLIDRDQEPIASDTQPGELCSLNGEMVHTLQELDACIDPKLHTEINFFIGNFHRAQTSGGENGEEIVALRTSNGDHKLCEPLENIARSCIKTHLAKCFAGSDLRAMEALHTALLEQRAKDALWKEHYPEQIASCSAFAPKERHFADPHTGVECSAERYESARMGFLRCREKEYESEQYDGKRRECETFDKVAKSCINHFTGCYSGDEIPRTERVMADLFRKEIVTDGSCKDAEKPSDDYPRGNGGCIIAKEVEAELQTRTCLEHFAASIGKGEDQSETLWVVQVPTNGFCEQLDLINKCFNDHLQTCYPNERNEFKPHSRFWLSTLRNNATWLLERVRSHTEVDLPGNLDLCPVFNRLVVPVERKSLGIPEEASSEGITIFVCFVIFGVIFVVVALVTHNARKYPSYRNTLKELVRGKNVLDNLWKLLKHLFTPGKIPDVGSHLVDHHVNGNGNGGHNEAYNPMPDPVGAAHIQPDPSTEQSEASNGQGDAAAAAGNDPAPQAQKQQGNVDESSM